MINDSIKELHELRGRLAAKNNLFKAKALQFDIDTKELRKEAALLAQEVTIAETRLRGEALLIYEKDMTNKQVAPGIVVKEFTEIGYDKKRAFDWAVDHKMALLLDEKTFEKIAPSANLDFVTVQQIPKATISQDLFKAVNEIQEAVNV